MIAEPPASEATPPQAPRLFAHGNRPLLAGLVSVILLIAFEAMAVATAMPRAVADLDGRPYYAWAFSAFVVTSLFAMVVSGEVCDARGPTRPMIVGVGLFTAGLLMAGTAVDMGVFVAARAVQGLGSGAVIVAVYVVVGRAFDESLRPRVFSLLSSAWVLPSLVGPTVAGFLADHASWRWVFLGVSVLVVPALLLMLPSLPALEGGQPVVATGRKRAALMVAVGLACLQYGGQRLDRVGLLFAVAGVLLVAPTIRRLLPPGTLRFARGLPTVIAMRGVLAGSFFGAETFIPLMLVSERGLTSTQAGLSLTGAALGWAAGLVPGTPHDAGPAAPAGAHRLRHGRDGGRAGRADHLVRRAGLGRRDRMDGRRDRHGPGDGLGGRPHAAAVAAPGPGRQLGGAAGQRLAVLRGHDRRRWCDLRPRAAARRRLVGAARDRPAHGGHRGAGCARGRAGAPGASAGRRTTRQRGAHPGLTFAPNGSPSHRRQYYCQ